MAILADSFYYQELRIDTINTRVFADLVAKEGDANGRGLLLTLTENGLMKDTTGITLILKWEHTSVGNQGLDNFDVVDPSKGLYKITYPTEMLNRGKIRAFIQIIDSGKLAGTRNFEITVDWGVGDDTAIASSDSFSALASALIEVQSWNARIDDVEQEFIDKANNLDATYPTRLVSVEQQLAEIKTFKQVVYLSDYPRLENETDDRNRFIRLFSAMDNVQELEVMVENEILLFSVPRNGYGISPPKNTTINSNNSEYHVETNGNPNYYLIDIRNDNVVFNGGVFVGDRETHDFTETGTHEWGHCFSINGALNVEINNVEISGFTGDGVYVGALGGQLTQYKLFRNKVLVYNSEIFNCRRQGISLINGQLDVIDCTIHNISGTAPSAAIDIEPNNVNEYTDLYVKNLNAYDCDGGGINMYANYASKIDGAVTNDIKYHKLKVDGFYYKNTFPVNKYGLYFSYNEGVGRSGGFEGSIEINNVFLKNSSVFIVNWSEHNPRIEIDGLRVENSESISIEAIVKFTRSTGYLGDFNIGNFTMLNYDLTSLGASYGVLINDNVGVNGVKKIILQPLSVTAATPFSIVPIRTGDTCNFIDPLGVQKAKSQISQNIDVTPVGTGIGSVTYDNTARRLKVYKNNNHVLLVGKFGFTSGAGSKTFAYPSSLVPTQIYTAFGTVQPLMIPIILFHEASSSNLSGLLTFDSTGFTLSLLSGSFVLNDKYRVFLNVSYLVD